MTDEQNNNLNEMVHKVAEYIEAITDTQEEASTVMEYAAGHLLLLSVIGTHTKGPQDINLAYLIDAAQGAVDAILNNARMQAFDED